MTPILVYQFKVTPNEAFVNRPKKIDLWQISFAIISFHNLFKSFKRPQLNEGQANDKEERKHVKKGIGTWWLVPVCREVCGWLV